MKICIYLRKSRADEEIEKTLGEGETLRKHRKALLKFAKENKLNIVEIKEEIVSGESLFFRPKMLELLKEVESNKYDGVLVMDMQRLGRGDMKDQGIILETFKNSNTKIITPMKTYDLSNDFDEEYSEFEAFMSRKELKMINRRMQGGRIRSVEDGNYISPVPPYGYDIKLVNKSRTLEINSTESKVVKLIFEMYVNGNGSGAIADYLNSLGYRTRFNNAFERSSVIFILKNLVYIGKVTWKKKDIKKSKSPNKIKDTKTRPVDEWIISNGKHKPIIDKATFDKAQLILKNKYHIPYQLNNPPVNPLAGLIICAHCGNKMVMRNLRGIPRILCTKKCGNVSIRFDILEKSILDNLELHLKKYKIEIKNKATTSNNMALYQKQFTVLNNKLTTLNNQKLKLFDLLERNIYDENVFLERSKNLNSRIEETTAAIKKLKKILSNKKPVTKNDIIKFENIIDAYKKTSNIKTKNELMKSLLYKVEYGKKERGNDFEIKLFIKLIP